MSYDLIIHPLAQEDMNALPKSQQVLVLKQFKKLKNSPQLGDTLGNKNGYDLSGCRKLYVDKKRIRIVYKIVDAQIIVEVIAIGKREDMEVYYKASSRL
ncbi:MAG: type II toxin-antitoxin system RelE/ParE family toxin [Campylobacterales bacterium]|nr:type II toxin-antitoxin system RelE/ParE family toxin [Campylobacterales bacterium]